jgi:hypothetical protein
MHALAVIAHHCLLFCCTSRNECRVETISSLAGHQLRRRCHLMVPKPWKHCQPVQPRQASCSGHCWASSSSHLRAAATRGDDEFFDLSVGEWRCLALRVRELRAVALHMTGPARTTPLPAQVYDSLSCRLTRFLAA